MAAREEVTLVIRARDLTASAFRRIRRGIGRIRLSLGSIIAGGAFGVLAREATQAATEVTSVADQLGITAEEAQALRTIAADIGVPFSGLATSIQRTSRNFGGALRGSEQLIENFLAAGIALDPNQFESSLDIFIKLVEQAKELGIESQVVQDVIGDIADSEGLAIIQRLARQGGSLRVEIDDLAQNIARPAAEIRRTAQSEAEIRRELLELQREFAAELRVLLPTLIEALRALNGAITLLNQFRQGGDARDAAIDTASREVSEALGLGGVRAFVAGETQATGGRAIGAELFNIGQQLAETGIGPRLFELQLRSLEVLERIAGATENASNNPNRGVFRIGQ